MITVYRVLATAVVVAFTISNAGAQFGGMPGLPGAPGAPGGGFGAPAAPPAQCQELLTLRDAVQKHGQALQAASKRKASPKEACRLFKNFIGAEAKMIRAIEKNGSRCGVPADVAPQIKTNHVQAGKVAKQVCDVAEQGPRQAGPSLSDALGASPPIPDNSKRGSGTFETLTGNPLSR